MASTDDINSTEKLLNVIRGKNEGYPGQVGKPKLIFISKKIGKNSKYFNI